MGFERTTLNAVGNGAVIAKINAPSVQIGLRIAYTPLLRGLWDRFYMLFNITTCTSACMAI